MLSNDVKNFDILAISWISYICILIVF